MDLYIEYAIRVKHLKKYIIVYEGKYHFQLLEIKDDILKFINDELNSKYTDSDIQSLKNYFNMNDIFYLKEINDLDLLNDIYSFMDDVYFYTQYEKVKEFINKYNKNDKK